MAGFLILVPIIIAFVLVGNWLNKKRRRELEAWAAAQGLTFSAERDPSMELRFPQFGNLRQGQNRYAHHVMIGEWGGRGFLGFDYHYETYTQSKHGRQTHHHYFSAVILLSEIVLKPLFVRPEGVFDRVSEFFGFDDIDFESAEFSRRFYVKAPERKWAYDVLHARAMEFLLGQPSFTLQLESTAAMACRQKRFAPAEFAQAAEVLKGLLDRLPSYVIKEQEDRAGKPPPLDDVRPAVYPPPLPAELNERRPPWNF